MFKRRLVTATLFFFGTLFLFADGEAGQPLMAETKEEATGYAPPPGSEASEIITKKINSTADDNRPVIIELFSSQACLFCPRADRLFADLIRQQHVIGLNCHVDYFDVREGSLSRPFCTARQNWYVETLGTGPNYTPQMILQGRIDVVGYHMERIVSAITKARELETYPLNIMPVAGTPALFSLSLPEKPASLTSENTVWLAFFDRPHDLTIADGRNKGQRVVYHNVVSQMGQLGTWDANTKFIEIESEGAHAGFVILIQDNHTGHIHAAGKHVFPDLE